MPFFSLIYNDWTEPYENNIVRRFHVHDVLILQNLNPLTTMQTAQMQAVLKFWALIANAVLNGTPLPSLTQQTNTTLAWNPAIAVSLIFW